MAERNLDVTSGNDLKTVIGKIYIDYVDNSAKYLHRVSIPNVCFKMSNDDTFCAPLSFRHICSTSSCNASRLDNHIYFNAPVGKVQITSIDVRYEGGTRKFSELGGLEFRVPETGDFVYIGDIHVEISRKIGVPMATLSITNVMTSVEDAKRLISKTLMLRGEGLSEGEKRSIKIVPLSYPKENIPQKSFMSYN
jgi:hypothetical protein